MPELKFYLSESFSSVTPVPFDGANLNCAEGRLNIHELGENALSAKRLIFGPQQNGFLGQSPKQGVGAGSDRGSKGESPSFREIRLPKSEF